MYYHTSWYLIESLYAYSLTGETYTLSDGTEYKMASEVAVLNRNVVIEGSTYPGLEDDGFGGRVIVSSVGSFIGKTHRLWSMDDGRLCA